MAARDLKAPDSRVNVRDFPGLIVNIDPNDLPPGAGRIQRNATSVRPAELRARPGFKEVTFDQE